MMKLVAIMGTAAFLAGCAGPTIYAKPGVTPEQERKDFAECNFEAVKATGSAPGGSITYDTSTTIANDLATGMRRGEIMQACLVAKGYSPKT
jgi:hypothetical protein